MTEDGAGRHLDELASKYAGRPIRYFGDAIPARFAETEVPVLCRIRPTHVVAVDATDGDGRRDDRGPSRPRRPRRRRPGRSPRPADATDLRRASRRWARDGQPQSSLVWVDFDGECARVNTTLERQKGRNLLADPKVSLLVVDPDDTARFIQIRGEAELVTDGARRAPRRADPQVHAPPALLRLHLPGRAGGPGDAGDLPDPRPADHASTRSTSRSRPGVRRDRTTWNQGALRGDGAADAGRDR